jgi:hypothetical protein
LRNAAAQRARAGIQPLPLPPVHTAGITQPIGVLPVVTPAVRLDNTENVVKPAQFQAPNLDSEDAPPAPPAGLQGLTSFASARPRPTANPAVPPRPAPQVVMASAELPQAASPGAQVTPIATDAVGDGPQQAIYFEATDQ